MIWVRPISGSLEVNNILVETNRKFYAFISSEHIENILLIKDALNSLFLSEFPSMSTNVGYSLIGTRMFRFSNTCDYGHTGSILHGIISELFPTYMIDCLCEEKMTF